jgi:hypothetical protein
MQDPRIIHWRQGEPEQNFGDFFTELMAQEVFLFPRVDSDIYRIVGSCISEWMIWDDLLKLGRQDNGRISYWGCGLRDETPIHPNVVERCRFHGVRGPLSRDVLGLPLDTPLMDPGLLAPLIHTPRPVPRASGRVLCMPHIADPKGDDELLKMSGAQAVVRPAVKNDVEELRKLLDVIASAEFLLTGSLHGAIFACAYNVPFAFWDNGHLDISFKWRDFAGSVGIPSVFVRNVEDGLKAYAELIAPVITRPKTFPLLSDSPIEVRPSVLVRSLVMDGVVSATDVDEVVEALEASRTERKDVRDAQVEDNVAFRRQLDGERQLSTQALNDELARLSAELSETSHEGMRAVSALQADISALQADIRAVKDAIAKAPWPVPANADGRALPDLIENLASRIQRQGALQSAIHQRERDAALQQARIVRDVEGERQGFIAKIMRLEDEVLASRAKGEAIQAENARLRLELEARRTLASS